MIDIYDEVGYIRNIIKDGLSARWQRDALLLARYYKQEGYKKKEIKDKLSERCMLGAAAGRFVYDPQHSYATLNQIVNNVWNSDVKLREIREIEFSKEVLDWFMSLENDYKISEEQMAEERKRRPKVILRGTTPINWNRTKFLFTLFVWTKIQENYLDKPNMHYLKKYKKRFKEDANLPLNFNLEQERNLLYDLGFININMALGIDVTFMKKFDVFQIPVTDENRVVLKTVEYGNISDSDIYNCGLWLDYYKANSQHRGFVCQRCHKYIIKKTVEIMKRPPTYCKPCARIIGHKKKETEMKTVECVDCGKEFEVPWSNHRTVRCDECQEKRNSEQNRQRVASCREKTKADIEL